MSSIDGRRAAIALTLLATLIVSAIYYAKSLARLDDRADANSELSFSDRLVAGGNSVIVNQEAATEADALIPRTETFRVRVGPRLRNAQALTSVYVESWYRYFLLPRRPAADARWIICYGCDTTELGKYVVRWHDGNGISIGRRG